MPMPLLAAMAGSAPQWGALAVLIIAIFAPSLLPRLARQAGRLLRRSVLRSLGFPQASGPDDQPRRRPEVLPPEHRTPTLRAGAQRPIQGRLPQPRPASIWPRVILAAAAAAVLLWYLLHPR
ncbi:MAG: hypothetical protein ACP5VE_04270 [Chthonomonadales bacterium]